MSNDKHTPTPWIQYGFEVFNENKKRAADCETTHDAARIVQCVNEYDGLIAKIELLKDSHREYLLVRSNLKDLTKDYNAAQSELESLQAEKAELIEALKQIEQFSDIGDGVLSGAIAVVRMKSIASQTLAKYETK